MQTERQLFEEAIQYRQFLERYKDGTYKLEWVEGRWQGWQMGRGVTEQDPICQVPYLQELWW